jgi:hypothetical protein
VWKYAVIGGTVVDEAGEPVVGVGVRALPRNVVGGRERFGNLDVTPAPTAVTDDRGMFRLSQLLPGTYVVGIPSTQTTLPIGVLDTYAQDTTLRSDCSSAASWRWRRSDNRASSRRATSRW